MTDAAGCTLLHVGVGNLSQYLSLPEAPKHSKKIDKLFACLRVVLEVVTSTADTLVKPDSAGSCVSFINQRNEKGLTALHMAAALPSNVHALQVVQLLLSHGADPLLVDSSGFTAETIAGFHANHLTVNRLQNGANRMAQRQLSAGAGQQYQPYNQPASQPNNQPNNQPVSQPPSNWPTSQPSSPTLLHQTIKNSSTLQPILVQAPPPAPQPTGLQVAGCHSVFSQQAPHPQSVQFQPRGQMTQPHQMPLMDPRRAPVPTLSTSFPPPMMHQPQLRPPLPHSYQPLVGNFHWTNFLQQGSMHGTRSRGTHQLPPPPN